jgi:hypothetical protein
METSLSLGQPVFHTIPSSVPGIEIIGPDNPGFNAVASEIIGNNQIEILRSALAISVVIKNTGTRPIVFYGIRFEYVTNAGNSVATTLYKNLRFPISIPFSPGQMRWEPAQPGGSTAQRSGQAASLVASKSWNQGVAFYTSRQAITASLDCAIFSDGQFAGPDISQAFNRLQAEAAANLQLLQELRQAKDVSDLDLRQMLDRIAASSQQTHSVSPSDAAMRIRTQHAKVYRRVLEARNLLNNPIFAPPDGY